MEIFLCEYCEKNHILINVLNFILSAENTFITHNEYRIFDLLLYFFNVTNSKQLPFNG